MTSNLTIYKNLLIFSVDKQSLSINILIASLEAKLQLRCLRLVRNSPSLRLVLRTEGSKVRIEDSNRNSLSDRLSTKNDEN